MTDHDDLCEAEHEPDTNAWTPCWCADRAAGFVGTVDHVTGGHYHWGDGETSYAGDCGPISN